MAIHPNRPGRPAKKVLSRGKPRGRTFCYSPSLGNRKPVFTNASTAAHRSKLSDFLANPFSFASRT